MHGSDAAFCQLPYFHECALLQAGLANIPITRVFLFLRILLRACLLACFVDSELLLQVHPSISLPSFVSMSMVASLSSIVVDTMLTFVLQLQRPVWDAFTIFAHDE